MMPAPKNHLLHLPFSPSNTQAMILEKYRQAARNAHNWTSFSPEKRGDSMIKDYSEQLESDLQEVKNLGGDPADYQTRYERFFSAWIGAKSRCFSSMITGPAKFPTRKAQKANNSEHNRYTEFQQFREKYIARLKRNQRREAKAAADPIAEMREDIKGRERLQIVMVEANKVIRDKKLTDEKKVQLLAELGIKDGGKLLTPDWCGRIGFAQYQLTNNSANIRRMRDRLAELEKKATNGAFTEEYPGGIQVVHNTEADRLQIFFPGKPDAETIQKLKRNAWKWSPSNGCWQRQLTTNAKWNVNEVLPK